MNANNLVRLQSGTPVIAVASGTCCGFYYEAGTVGIVTIFSDDSEKKFYIRFTRSVRLDFTFMYQKWEPLMRCGSCSRAYPANTLSMCATCERPEFCNTCLESHECVIPRSGIGRHPRKQVVINQLKEQKVLCR